MCQLLAPWTTITCLHQASSHTGFFDIRFEQQNSQFFSSSDGKFKHGFHKSSTGLSKYALKKSFNQYFANFQSLWHRSLPWKLKPVACVRLGEQPDCCDGSQLVHWSAQVGEKPHKVGLMIAKRSDSDSPIHFYLLLTGCLIHSGWQPLKTP